LKSSTDRIFKLVMNRYLDIINLGKFMVYLIQFVLKNIE
jgi:hypothetical protein